MMSRLQQTVRFKRILDHTTPQIPVNNAQIGVHSEGELVPASVGLPQIARGDVCVYAWKDIKTTSEDNQSLVKTRSR